MKPLAILNTAMTCAVGAMVVLAGWGAGLHLKDALEKKKGKEEHGR